MTTPAYHAALRDIRAQFRAGEFEGAYLNAAALARAHPDVEEIGTFLAGAARKLNALMREASRSGAYSRAAAQAERLIGDDAFGKSAQEVLLDAVSQDPDPAASVQTLLRYADADPANTAFWAAIGGRLAELEPSAANIETGFRLLGHLPGHPAGLAGLSRLVTGADASGAGPAAEIPAEVAAVIAAVDPVETSAATRRGIYDGARAVLAQTAFPSTHDRTLGRLALEQRIARLERSSQIGGSGALLDSWSVLDPNSPHFVLGDEHEPRMPTAQLVHPAPARPLGLSKRFIIALSLWLQSTNRDISRDRIGYLWLVLDPLIHILLICAIPMLLHRAKIMDMGVFPFGVIGACFWLVFRLSAIGAMSGGGVLTSQLEHPPLRRFDVIFARALHALVVYLIVGATLMTFAMATGQSAPPQNLAMVLVLLVINWLMGLSYGIIGSSLLAIYPGFRRINGFLIRIYGLTAGLFYVTEMISERISAILLYNPLLHSVQLARAFWFPDYETTDSSWTYLLLWLGGIGLAALILLTLDERRVQRVRA